MECLVKYVWFVVDEYYSTQTFLGYMYRVSFRGGGGGEGAFAPP